MVKKFVWNRIVYGRGQKDELVCYYAYYGDEELGFIEYYKKWKKWVWNQGEDIIMSSSCIEEVLKKLKQMENKK